MFKTIISVSATVNPLLRTGISPQYDYVVKAVKLIEGNTKEECISQVRDFIRKNGFTITKEENNE